MLQSLDVISVNLWQIIVALLNLTLLFWLVKKFLFKPVKKVMQKRQDEIDMRYSEAELAQKDASESKQMWEEKLKGASEQADMILSEATENARNRSDKIVSDARHHAQNIVNQAEMQAELEYKKASDDMKREIVSVSSVLAEKMLEREIDEKDHRNLIDSFINEIGENNDGSK